jgi:hypothetical protein
MQIILKFIFIEKAETIFELNSLNFAIFHAWDNL